MFDHYKVGGVVGGAIAGAMLGGPLGMVLGGAAGYYAGGATENEVLKREMSKVNTAITLIGGPQSVGVTKGGTVGILPPQGGSIVSLAPAMGSAIGFLRVLNPGKNNNIGNATAAASGDVNVTWRAPDGSPQASVITITAIG
jgi:hypothetical protein